MNPPADKSNFFEGIFFGDIYCLFFNRYYYIIIFNFHIFYFLLNLFGFLAFSLHFFYDFIQFSSLLVFLLNQDDSYFLFL
jgi:hypothetical protein